MKVCSLIKLKSQFFYNWTKLYLSEPPVINRSFSGNLSITVGAFQVFTCSVTSGADPLTFSYYLNGNLIQGSSNVKIETHDKFALLRLRKIEKSHAGKYVCEVVNRYGKDEAIVWLNVNGIVSVQRVALRCPLMLQIHLMMRVRKDRIYARQTDSLI